MDKTFTFSGLKKEFQRIRWPKWFERKNASDKAIIPTSLGVLGVVGFFALFFMICDLVSGLLLRLGL